jgi:hypothetical protein
MAANTGMFGSHRYDLPSTVGAKFAATAGRRWCWHGVREAGLFLNEVRDAGHLHQNLRVMRFEVAGVARKGKRAL